MSNTFCPLLFQHLATHPHGGVTHCCVADHRQALSSSRDGNRFYNNSVPINMDIRDKDFWKIMSEKFKTREMKLSPSFKEDYIGFQNVGFQTSPPLAILGPLYSPSFWLRCILGIGAHFPL